LNLTRDDAGNVLRRLFSEGPDLRYGYDAQNRMGEADGVTLARDAEGRVTATTSGGRIFGASYDGSGRLAAATYDNGAFTVSYTYSVGEGGTGLLTDVADSLTGTQVTFGYDDDGRLRTTTLPNGEIITRTWDGAGRLARLQSGNFVDLSLTYDAAGRITGVEMLAPVTPDEHLWSETASLTYDAASQVASPGYAHDPLGRVTTTPRHGLSWDGASRLTGADGATLAYDGLGQVRTRTGGGAATRYEYNQAIAMAPVVAERDHATGQALRYYVWTPEGRLLYLIDAEHGNAVRFVHSDQVGSTLALTDAAGDLTDAYAYDPYGRLLSHQGDSSQPFTFVGAWGVRQEGGGGEIYQMRARTYDASTGRFLSPEPLWPQLLEPKALNPYTYTGGDPVRFIDPTGLTTLEDLQKLVSSFLSEFEASAFDNRPELNQAARLAGLIYARQKEGLDVSWLAEELDRVRKAGDEKWEMKKDFILGKRMTIWKLFLQMRMERRKLEENLGHLRGLSNRLLQLGKFDEARVNVEDIGRQQAEVEQARNLEEALFSKINEIFLLGWLEGGR
jgi:RHS repeat-associated protein